MIDGGHQPAGFRVCEDGHVEVMTVEEVDYLLACFWSDALKQLRPEQYDD
ncbi:MULTISPECIES: hypothetical protein [unclassified Bradyrhizobium]|nr:MULTISPECIES: hypothetical protein [unclassified Bradyrhizobium]WGR70194.1 hypothetical protein MTX24_33125 [Bradyrhizobium sp. ISRA426]WGR82251.1 hypothetical protein MTX21_18230 [Bradyrhizobium sp. ISRA430]WGR85437.1 hypothetical protein MTX25_32800 [Bradyrhizobium sp. ISRA432]